MDERVTTRLDNMPPEPILGDETAEERLRRIDPTKLLVLSVEELDAFLDAQFPELVKHAKELQAAVDQWRADHTAPKTHAALMPIRDDAENDALSDLMRKLRDFADEGTGEVEKARKPIKDPLFKAGRHVDAWFNRLRDPINMAIGPAKHALPGQMQYAQTVYLKAKLDKERADREAAARAAEDAARAVAEEARRLAADEMLRIAAMKQDGIDEEEAVQIAADQTDQAVAEAEAALAHSELVGAAAAAPDRDLVRSRSAIGTSTTLGGSYELDETNIDVMKLCKAVVSGVAPVTFITANVRAIKLAIKEKVNPLRECDGLTITRVFAAQRRG